MQLYDADQTCYLTKSRYSVTRAIARSTDSDCVATITPIFKSLVWLAIAEQGATPDLLLGMPHCQVTQVALCVAVVGAFVPFCRVSPESFCCRLDGLCSKGCTVATSQTPSVMRSVLGLVGMQDSEFWLGWYGKLNLQPVSRRGSTSEQIWGRYQGDDRQVMTVFTVQPSFHHRHSANPVSWSVTIVGERAVTPHLVVRRGW